MHTGHVFKGGRRRHFGRVLIPLGVATTLSFWLFHHFLLLLCPRTVKQTGMASKPLEMLPLPNGMPCPRASGRHTLFILSGTHTHPVQSCHEVPCLGSRGCRFNQPHTPCPKLWWSTLLRIKMMQIQIPFRRFWNLLPLGYTSPWSHCDQLGVPSW